ncbi:MAG: hypothetical protein ABR881_29610 [Candidatus Sulfotelmatobacter sp.]|jgi:hypothetical protein
MSLAELLRAKQKRDAEEAAKRRAARIARKVARVAPEPSGLYDLPLEIAVAMEESPAQPVKPAPVQTDETVANLVSRLEAIRERIWRLQSMFAVTLSHDCALEANRYLQLFQELAQQLKDKDQSALGRLVRGHESSLLSPAIPMKQSIPLATQRLCEIRWEASQAPVQRAPKRPADSVPDGLGWML